MLSEEVLLKYQEFWAFINTFDFPIYNEVKAIIKDKQICFLTDGKKFAYIDNKQDFKEKVISFINKKDKLYNVLNNGFQDHFNIPISILVKMETKPLRYLRFLFNNGSEAHDTHIAQNTEQITLLSFF
jgi:hypothetical protein